MLEIILIYGLVSACTLMLTALGFSLTFGLSGVANFAHGGMYLLSAYLTWMLLNKLGLPLLVAAPITIVVTGLLGALIYQVVLRRVRGIQLAEVVSTFALGVAMLESFRWLGFVTYDFNLPVFFKGGTTIGSQVIDYHRMSIVVVALAMAGLLWVFTHHTKTGLGLRGMAQDEHTALSVGIESDWAAMVSMALGSALAAVAAITILPLGIISINAGYDVLLIALAITVVGGIESTRGLMAASLILGYATVIVSNYIAPHWSEIIYMAAIVLTLIFKPSGIFGKFKELEERV